jgi:glycine/D-amino acid oxidase-like deaminating enzyme
MDIDFLIVGQGLAGSLLAWRLLKAGFTLRIVDYGNENASQIAAGLINPVSGQRLVKALNTEYLLSSALQCYRELEAFFAEQFFIEMPMLRILQSQQQKKYAHNRLQQSDYQSFISSWLPSIDGVQTDYGVLQQVQTGYLRTRLLLSCLQKWFINSGNFLQSGLDYFDIQQVPALQWQALKPRYIVFCEGYQGIFNPWFGGLPFQLAKGEIITGEATKPLPVAGSILNYGKWLIPLPGGFKTGATFDSEHINVNITKSAEDSLLTALRLACPGLEIGKLIEHKAGVRPTTLDKKPFIGAHPKYRNLLIFNGFGGKGSLSIPWYSEIFIEAILGRQQLPADCDISRYYARHFPN